MLDINPDFALQSRLSFGRGARYGWGLAAFAVFLAFNPRAEPDTTEAALARAGAFLLLGALPYGAINVRRLDIGGRLDARRLTGRSPVALALALVGGSAWALLLAGAVLLLAGLAGGASLPAITLAAFLAMGATMALLVLLAPSSAQIDSWLLLVLLFLGVVLTVYVMGNQRSAAHGVLIVSAVTCPWALPLALRRLRGASPAPRRRPSSVLRPFVRMDRTARPEFTRGLLSAGSSAAAAAVMCFVAPLLMYVVLARFPEQLHEPLAMILIYAPLLLAGYDAAARVRAERSTGALDCVRLTGQDPWRVVLESAAVFSLPFVTVSLVSAAALALLEPRLAGLLRPWPLTAGLLVFGGVAEGLRGRRPGLYLAGLSFAALVLGNSKHGWLPGLFAVAVAAMVATGSLERGDRAPLRGKAAVVAFGMLAAAAVAFFPSGWTGPLIAGLLALGSGLLVPDRAPLRNRTVAACAAAAAVAAGIATYYWVEDWPLARFSWHVRLMPMKNGGFNVFPVIGHRGVYSALVAAAAGVGVLYGCFVHNQFGRTVVRSFVWRGLLLGCAVAVTVATRNQTTYFAFDALGRRTGYNGYAILELMVLGCFAVAVVLLGWRERKVLQRG